MNMASLRVGRRVLNVFESGSFCSVLSILSKRHCPVRNIHLARHLDAERKFTKEHEWVTLEDQVGTVGISDHAQTLLGDIVYVELPALGKEIDQHDIFGVVESVKAASDLYSPVSGEVVEVNEALQETPDLVNKEPYENGWIMKIKLSDPTQLNELMDEAAYTKYVQKSEDE